MGNSQIKMSNSLSRILKNLITIAHDRRYTIYISNKFEFDQFIEQGVCISRNFKRYNEFTLNKTNRGKNFSRKARGSFTLRSRKIQYEKCKEKIRKQDRYLQIGSLFSLANRSRYIFVENE